MQWNALLRFFRVPISCHPCRGFLDTHQQSLRYFYFSSFIQTIIQLVVFLSLEIWWKLKLLLQKWVYVSSHRFYTNFKVVVDPPQSHWFKYPCSLISSGSSVQFSRSVVWDSFRPHGLQHTRLPCPSPTPGADSNSCPLSQWCHPTISSSVIPFSSCHSVFPSIRVFSNESALQIRWPKYWTFSFSISPSNEYSRLISFRTDSFDLLAVQGTGHGGEFWQKVVHWRREWQTTSAFLLENPMNSMKRQKDI